MNLSRFAFVVVSDTGNLPKGLEQNLESYANGGGQVLVLLGRSFASGGTVPVTRLRADGAHYTAAEAVRFQTVAYADGTYPPISRGNLWDGVRFYQSIVVEPEGARVLAKLADDTPLLLEQSVGEGRVLVFTSPLDNVGSDFPVSTSFVPFVEQTSHYLGGLDNGSSNFTAGAYADLRTAKEKGAPVEVIGPDGKRALSLSESTKAQTIQLANEGYYEIRHANGRHELDSRESGPPGIGFCVGSPRRPQTLGKYRTDHAVDRGRQSGAHQSQERSLVVCHDRRLGAGRSRVAYREQVSFSR